MNIIEQLQAFITEYPESESYIETIIKDVESLVEFARMMFEELDCDHPKYNEIYDFLEGYE